MAALAHAFDEACAGANWQRIAELASALGPQLQAWAAAPLTRAERQAMIRLRLAHDRAGAASVAAMNTLDSQLAAIRNNKDGWLAYALAGDTETA